MNRDKKVACGRSRSNHATNFISSAIQILKFVRSQHTIAIRFFQIPIVHGALIEYKTKSTFSIQSHSNRSSSSRMKNFLTLLVFALAAAPTTLGFNFTDCYNERQCLFTPNHNEDHDCWQNDTCQFTLAWTFDGNDELTFEMEVQFPGVGMDSSYLALAFSTDMHMGDDTVIMAQTNIADDSTGLLYWNTVLETPPYTHRTDQCQDRQPADDVTQVYLDTSDPNYLRGLMKRKILVSFTHYPDYTNTEISDLSNPFPWIPLMTHGLLDALDIPQRHQHDSVMTDVPISFTGTPSYTFPYPFFEGHDH